MCDEMESSEVSSCVQAAGRSLKYAITHEVLNLYESAVKKKAGGGREERRGGGQGGGGGGRVVFKLHRHKLCYCSAGQCFCCLFCSECH